METPHQSSLKLSPSPTSKELSSRLASSIKNFKTSTTGSISFSPEFPSIFDRLNEQVSVNDTVQSMTTSTVRYSDADLGYFRNIIMGRLEKEQAELQYLRQLVHIGGDESNSLSNDDFIQDSQDESFIKERNHFMEMISRKIKLIKNLKEALIRIENKTYGICRATGKLIDKERLKLVPHATLSKEAKERGIK